jgi:hypothetical protein
MFTICLCTSPRYVVRTSRYLGTGDTKMMMTKNETYDTVFTKCLFISPDYVHDMFTICSYLDGNRGTSTKKCAHDMFFTITLWGPQRRRCAPTKDTNQKNRRGPLSRQGFRMWRCQTFLPLFAWIALGNLVCGGTIRGAGFADVISRPWNPRPATLHLEIRLAAPDTPGAGAGKAPLSCLVLGG